MLPRVQEKEAHMPVAIFIESVRLAVRKKKYLGVTITLGP
jgi:hypothetical protein